MRSPLQWQQRLLLPERSTEELHTDGFKESVPGESVKMEKTFELMHLVIL